MFSNLKIAVRLALGFGALQMGKINDGVFDIVNAADVGSRMMHNAPLTGNIVLLSDKEQLGTNKAKYDENVGVNDEHMKHLDRLVASPKGKELLKTLHETLVPFRAFNDEVIALGLAEKKPEVIQLLFGETSRTQIASFSAAKAASDHESQSMKNGAKAAAQRYSSARTRILGLSAGALVLGIGIAL